MEKRIKKLLVTPEIPIKEAMKKMDMNGEKILFVIDKLTQRFLGSLTDGDIRRWILSNGSLRESVLKVFNQTPRWVDQEYKISQVKKMMLTDKLEQIPVVDNQAKLVDVLLWENVFSGKVVKADRKIKIPVVIMAGGKGTRLDPFTRILPKPLIPINGEAIIKLIMDKFWQYGVEKFYISINHKSRMIQAYFEELSVEYQLEYITENKELGTAGCLCRLKGKLQEPLLVTNCDIIIEHDYRDILDFHNKQQCDITVIGAVKHYTIPYGICEINNGGDIQDIKEKPEYDFLISTGMYILNPAVLALVPKDRKYHMTDLIEKAKQNGMRVKIFPVHEKAWIDIGEWDLYRKAIKALGE